MIFANEIFTIQLSDLHARWIYVGLKMLKESKSYEAIGNEELLKVVMESFHNLSNGKVAEVNEVTIINPQNINVLKREKLPDTSFREQVSRLTPRDVTVSRQDNSHVSEKNE